MTERLFYQDSYIKEFEAQVISCEQNKGRYEIVLDRTAFYPEGGGQPGDDGILVLADGKQVAVTDTHEKGSEILHYTEEALEPGTRVHGEINWTKRFDLMQNHSGEHIVSGIIHSKYGYENVGFHMGSDFITIDMSGELTFEQLQEIEDLANAAVWANTETGIVVYDEESVKSVEYRSKKELHGDVRIVTFVGSDVCACCGTHVKRTGEIGLIRIYSVVKFRGGVRIELLCGRRALEYDRKLAEQNRQISLSLSATPLGTAEAVEKVKTQAAADKFRLIGFEKRMIEQEASKLAGAGNVLIRMNDGTADAVRNLCAEVIEKNGGICAVYGGNDKDGYKFAVGQKDGDLRAYVKEMNAALNGRGGGKPFFAMGSVAADWESICQYIIGNKTDEWTVLLL